MPFIFPDRAEIASYLATVSAITFFSEMEEKLKEIVRERFYYAGDQKLAHFLSKINEQNLRRMKRGDISETVALFGDQCKVEFQAEFPDSELRIYHNVIQDRHRAAHSSGSDVTLAEVEIAAEIAERMLTAIKQIIK